MDVTTTAESVEFVAHNLISSLATRYSQPFSLVELMYFRTECLDCVAS